MDRNHSKPMYLQRSVVIYPVGLRISLFRLFKVVVGTEISQKKLVAPGLFVSNGDVFQSVTAIRTMNDLLVY